MDFLKDIAKQAGNEYAGLVADGVEVFFQAFNLKLKIIKIYLCCNLVFLNFLKYLAAYKT